jgi:hypothetical protein
MKVLLKSHLMFNKPHLRLPTTVLHFYRYVGRRFADCRSSECRGAVIFSRLLKNSQLLLKREDERLDVDTNHRMRINTGKKRGEQRGEKIQLPPENWTQGVNVIILCLSLTGRLNKLDSCECTPALTAI